jgi:hypothetical protein
MLIEFDVMSMLFTSPSLTNNIKNENTQQLECHPLNVIVLSRLKKGFEIDPRNGHCSSPQLQNVSCGSDQIVNYFCYVMFFSSYVEWYMLMCLCTNEMKIGL